MVDLEKDLEEAKDLLEGRSHLLCELRHLRAIQNHYDDQLIVLALKTARLHDDILAT